MRTKLFLPVVALSCALALVAGACSSDDEAAKDKGSEATTTSTTAAPTTTTTEAPTESVFALIDADDDLSQFAGLLVQAGLDTQLAEGGPWTVIAPTNAAWDALSDATVARLEQDPRGALANVLKLHLISGNVTWDDLIDEDGSCVTTVGGPVKVEVDGEGEDAAISFGGAALPQQDAQAASNGTILKTDSVTTAPATDCP